MSMLDKFASLVGWQRYLRPIAPLLLLTAGCLVVQEEYPFSDFPMYSSFGDSTYYVFLADAQDEPLATYEVAGMSTPTLKKVFASELRRQRKAAPPARKHLQAEHKNAAATAILMRLKEAAALRPGAPATGEIWRLYEVNILLEDGHYRKQTSLLAEL